MTICLFFCLAVSSAQATSPALLQDIAKSESFEETVLALTLSEASEFRLKVSGQRIDLSLPDTVVSPYLGRIPQEGSVQRILLIDKGTELLVSFLMARPPQKARIESDDMGKKLSLHLDWNIKTINVRPAIATSLKGTIMQDDSGNVARVSARSRYASRWRMFFSEFRAPGKMQMPITYTLPFLDSLGLKPISVALRQAVQLGKEGLWAESLNLLNSLDVNGMSPEDREVHHILSATMFLYTGDYDSTRQHFRQFSELYPSSSLLKIFQIMSACGRAQNGDPYGAASAISHAAELKRKGGAVDEALAELLFAEVYLDTGRPGKALFSLERLAGFKGDMRIAAKALLRTADANAALGRYREALKGYREWFELEGDGSMGPYSLVSLASTYEQHGDFKGAEGIYALLAEQVKDEGKLAMVLFAYAGAAAKRGDSTLALDRCMMVINDYPDTEGAVRARLLKIDLNVIGSNKEQMLENSREYRRIASGASNLILREEAAFKEALAQILGGRTRQGLELLKDFRRQFTNGLLHGEAEFLTLEKLEPLVVELLEKGENIEALVLIEQNRELLAAYSLPADFAVKVAVAFRALGLLNKSSFIYSYLLTNTEGTDVEERYYLPLIEVLYDDGRYQEVIKNVSRYRERFPAGMNLSSLQLYQGRALIALGKLDEAVALLPKLQMSSPEVLALRNKLITSLAVRDGLDANVLGGMLQAKAPGEQINTRLLRAERLMSEGRGDQALEIYQQLITADNVADQALYRSGQICLDRGERQRGINFLTDLVDKSNDSYWQNLGREMLALAKAN